MVEYIMKKTLFLWVLSCLCFVGFVNAADSVITEGFEYSTTSDLYAAGWSHLYGSPGDMVMADSEYSSRLPRSGTYCLLAPGDKSPNVVQKTFFATSQNNATVEFWLRHRTASNLNAAYSWMSLYADDGASLYMKINPNNGNIIYNLNGSGDQASSAYLVNNQVEWSNKFTIVYDAQGDASAYHNESLICTFDGAGGFSKIALGRSWAVDSGRQSAYDDLSITLLSPYCGDEIYSEGDLNRDCIVNFGDFAVFSEEWLNESAVSFIPNPNDIYEDFEYGNWITMHQNYWFSIGESEPVISNEFSRSKLESIIIPSGQKGAVEKTFYPKSQTDIEVQISQLERSVESSGLCAVRASDDEGNYVMLKVGYQSDVGYTVVQARYNNSTWVNYPSLSPPPAGWNDLKFVFDSSGYLDLYVNDNFVDTTSVLNGFTTLGLMKNWTTFGTPIWDRLTIVNNPDTSDGFCDAQYSNGLPLGDYNQDCMVNIDDLSIIVDEWLNSSSTYTPNPASISGTITDVNGKQVDALIGFNILDENGTIRNPDGSIAFGNAYEGGLIWHNRYQDDGISWSLPEVHVKGEGWSLWMEAYPKWYSEDGSQQATDVSTYMRNHWHSIPIQPGQVIDDIDIEFEYSTESAVISGKLTEGGTPVAGQRMVIWANHKNSAMDFAFTDSNGNFVFDHTAGWAKHSDDFAQIVSPVQVRIFVDGVRVKTIDGVGPNDVISGVNIDLQEP
jgi:hypothetical protein